MDKEKCPPLKSAKHCSTSEIKNVYNICSMNWSRTPCTSSKLSYEKNATDLFKKQHLPFFGRWQPWSIALLSNILRAALTTACCPWLGVLIGATWPRMEDLLTVARKRIASSTFGTITAFHNFDIHLKKKKDKCMHTCTKHWTIYNSVNIILSLLYKTIYHFHNLLCYLCFCLNSYT